MSKIKPAEFIQQVKQETGRITWPKRQEITTTTTIVLILVAISAVFFLVIDRIMYYIIQQILSLGI
jgi:preprotein translocase subunit SecE